MLREQYRQWQMAFIYNELEIPKMEEIYAFVCDFSLIALDKVYKYLDDDEAKRAEFKRYVMDCQKKKVHIIATMDQINIL